MFYGQKWNRKYTHSRVSFFFCFFCVFCLVKLWSCLWKKYYVWMLWKCTGECCRFLFGKLCQWHHEGQHECQKCQVVVSQPFFFLLFVCGDWTDVAVLWRAGVWSRSTSVASLQIERLCVFSTFSGQLVSSLHVAFNFSSSCRYHATTLLLTDWEVLRAYPEGKAESGRKVVRNTHAVLAANVAVFLFRCLKFVGLVSW